MATGELAILEVQAEDLGALLGELDDEEWDLPTRCEGWTVKDVAAHCESMLRRLAGGHSAPADGEAEIDRAGYYAYDPDGPRQGEEASKTFSEAIRDRVLEEAVGREGAEIRDAYLLAARQTIETAREVPAARVIERSGHPRITFGEFVATRVLELGIHEIDIGHATRRGERIHPDAVPVVGGILDGRLGSPLPRGLGWDPRTYILTGSGRRPLERGERYVLGPLAARFPLFR
jgi:uncharacterized protein (TIGR03083 family)